VFAVGEFRVLWLAQGQSVAGDQLARVAMTVLVFERTRSPLWTALTYAGTFLPWIVGGLALAPLADRFPRRRVLVACDLARAVLVAVMAVPAVPLAVMVALLFIVTLFDSPFKAGRAALYADILDGELYVLGIAVTQTTIQAATVAGFALGGVVTGAVGARPALAIDAGTFAVSAVLVLAGVRPRPAAGRREAGVPAVRQIGGGLRLVFGDRAARTVMLLAWLGAFYSVPEPLAVPYAARLGGGAVAAGLVFASGPLGAGAGMVALGRLAGPSRRLAWMGPLAAGACAVLLACASQPGLAWSLVIFTVSGAFGCYQMAANAAFVAAVPAERRGQAFGVANAGLQAGQGLAYLGAGAAAEAVAPATVIAVSGGLGAAVAVVLAVSWRRHSAAVRPPPGDAQPAHAERRR
jgi:MFS family permease